MKKETFYNCVWLVIIFTVLSMFIAEYWNGVSFIFNEIIHRFKENWPVGIILSPLILAHIFLWYEIVYKYNKEKSQIITNTNKI